VDVAAELSAHDALEAHARDELGLADDRRARPLQAAGASALSFAAGAVLPLLAIGIFGSSIRVVICIAVTMLALAGLGALGARLGGAPEVPAVVRVVFWGAVAIGVTSAIGALVGSVV
jgi:VIT1/CCC1 family predicted Fe2+/Mn2+ transporter